MPPNGWGQAPGYPPQQAPRKRKKWPWVLLGVFVLLIGGCVAIVAGTANSVSNDINKSKTVVYHVTGTAKDVNVSFTTWNNGNSSTSQEDVTLPWSQQETSSGLFSGGFLIVTVGSGGGTATCSVTVNNGTPMTATANGALTSANCQSD